MDDIKNKSESCNTDQKNTVMKERAELSDTPGRDEVTEEDKDNESPRNENAEKGDTEDLGMQLWTNPIIMREIMSHLDWREQLPCELVCRLWRDAVKSVQRTRSLCSYDFVLICDVEYPYKIKLHVRDMPVETRPMCAISFYNNFHGLSYPCEDFSPAPCDPPCATEHTIIQAAHEVMLSKCSDLLAVPSSERIYKRFPDSLMIDNYQDNFPFIVGLYLPKIPNVNYRTVHYYYEDTAQEDFYRVVDDICTTDIIKGVVFFAEQNYIQNVLEYQNGNLGFLNYIKNKQPSIPYALGGCDTGLVVCKGIKYKESYEKVTMGVFSVPKEPEPGPPCQFNMYSLIIDSTMQEEAAIQEAIQTFVGNIPELQYSAALMLSGYKPSNCDWDDFVIVQDVFRASFPRTHLVGCYSFGLIGYNHPDIRPQPTKATRRASDSGQDFVQDGSTVLVYFSWGKQRTDSGEEAHHTQQ